MFFLPELSLLKKLIKDDNLDVSHSRLQQLNYYFFSMRLFIALRFFTGCPSTRYMKHLHKLIIQRLITNVPPILYQHGLALAATGQCAAAMVHLNRAIPSGHLPSRALMAWMMIESREGVAKDRNAAFELVEEGARLGCHHCQGVMAWCYWGGDVCEEDAARSLELARESSGKGSRYGQYVLGRLYQYSDGVVAQDYAQAVALFRLAAAQNLDAGQCSLGVKYHQGLGVVKDDAKALWLYQLAAAQGHVTALFNVASCYERGIGVPKNTAQAIFWYERAQAAGHKYAGYAVDRLKLL